MTTCDFAATTVDVTPAVGLPMSGYIARDGAVAIGKHDPLEASILWLGDIVWVALDSLCVDEGLASSLRQGVGRAIGIPVANVLICASHTHAGPSGWIDQVYPSDPAVDPELRQALVSAVTAAAGSLAGQQRPAEVSWVRREVAGVGANRNHPDGPHDKTCGALVVRGEGRVVGVLVDYACHPTVLDHDNRHWSADWPGVARRRLAAATGATVAFLQGAAGDVSPRFVRRGRDFDEVERLGGLLADAVTPALGTVDPAVRLAAPALLRSRVRLPVRTLVPAGVSVPDGTHPPGSPQDRISRSRVEAGVLLERMVRAERPVTLDLPVTAVAAGEVAWLHLPVELFASLGQRIAHASPFPQTRVIGYTDAYCGYVADRAGHDAGTYEALISLFDVAASERLVGESIGLLRRLWSEHVTAGAR